MDESLIVRRSRDDRLGIASGAFGVVLFVGCVVAALLTSIVRDISLWWILVLGVMVVAEGTTMRRAFIFEVRRVGDDLVVQSVLPTKSIAVSAVRFVSEGVRFRRVSTTTIHLAGGRSIHTKAATKRQLDSLSNLSSAEPAPLPGEGATT